MAGVVEEETEHIIEDVIETVENSVEIEQDNDGSSEKHERVLRFPLTRIKTIIKTDSDVTIASHDAVVLIAKATVHSFRTIISSFSSLITKITALRQRLVLRGRNLVSENVVMQFVDKAATFSSFHLFFLSPVCLFQVSSSTDRLFISYSASLVFHSSPSLILP
jgi:hypothetical protein